MFIRSTLVLASLALPLAAQDAEITAASAQDGGAAAFYKAYFLDNTQARSKAATKQALELYSRFLANHADHQLAGQAASRMLVLIYATGNMDRAGAHAKKYSAQITKVNEAARAARGNRGRGGRGDGDNPNQEIIAKLREASQNAEGAERTAISAAMRRLGGSRFGRGGFGGRGGREGGRGGFGGRGGRSGSRGGRGRGVASIPKIADMQADEAKKAVEQFVTSMERIIDLMAQRGQADQADKLEAKLDKVQDLVDDGKLKEAQKILDSFEAEMGNMLRGGGRRGGGDQGGGRRRRGGDGGDTGGRRRRGGGDGGDTGGRRRRGGGDGKIK